MSHVDEKQTFDLNQPTDSFGPVVSCGPDGVARRHAAVPHGRFEPRIQNAARRTNDRFRKVGRELSSFASGKGTLRQSFVHTLPLRDRHPEVLGQPSSVYGKPSNA